jgi:outer membrane protein
MKRLPLILAILCLPLAAYAQVWDLAALEQISLQHSPLIKQAHAGRDAARARAVQARSGFWPQVQASAAIENASTRQGEEQGQSQEAGLSLQQAIFDYSLWFGWQSANWESMAFEEEVRAARNDVVTQVRRAYFAIQQAQRLLAVAIEARKDTAAFRDRAQIMLDNELIPRLDLARAEYDLAEAARRIIESEANLRKRYADLALATGWDAVYRQEMPAASEVAFRPEILNYSEDRLISMALRFRPEIKRLELLAQAAAAAIDQARGGHLPVLSFQGSISRGGNYDWAQEGRSYGLYLSVPLFQGLRVEGAIVELEALHRQALQVCAQMRLNVTQQTRLAYQDLQETLAKVEVSRNQVASAEENWRLVESSYMAGLATALELSEARTNRFAALAALATDQVTVLSNLAALDQTVGGALFPFAFLDN